jgi:RNase H-like domain found in reverse transcriptase
LQGRILEHYDPKKPIVVVCDASDDGLSGILCHIVGNDEKPVFFIWCTLSSAEKNYPILHREALAIVFAMERFYKYVYGHHVTILSDHKPLEAIFGMKKGEPPVVANRLQRYVC